VLVDRGPRPPRLGPSIVAHWRSDRPVALELPEDLLQDDPPPGDELPAGPVAAAGRQTRAERIRAGRGQDYRGDRDRANRYAAATCCGLQPTIFDGSPFFPP
jgi:hypothetical protein